MSSGGAVEIEFPPELPISSRVLDIARAIDAHPVVVVAGATGSGKTTQLPKIALAMGRGVDRIIGVTQPRRIAATSTAARVASELGSPLGTDVGYQIRFEDKTTDRTYVKFMTDGILLAEIKGDPLLRRYDTLILDEAHERSLTIDFLLGWVKRILPQRPDLKVIVSSATLETERFSDFFGGAPILEVEGRTFPVDVLYEKPDDDADLAEAIGNAVANVTALDPRGDILVFLPGEREIRDAENELRARNLRHTVIQPLYARLSSADQRKVFSTVPERRVILATNVAETSITIPGIVYVIDPGIARLSRYEPRSGTTTLQVEAISRASADQRKGRCGRVRDGICVRLYDEDSFRARPGFTDPEIKRTGLAGVILRMKSLGLGDVDEFPFLDPPGSRSITEGYRVLEELGAITGKRELTPLGERLARFPVDPRIARMIVAGAEKGCLDDMLVVAAALSIQDPRERPAAAKQQADEAHRRFRDDRSDFVSYLRLWEFVQETAARGTGELRRTCQRGFLSFLRVREWIEVHRQLGDAVRDLGISAARRTSDPDALHRALLTGLLSRVGAWHPEHRVYLGAKQTRFAIHPSSPVSRKPPAWIMAFELVETSQLFARSVAKLDPEWLEEEGAHLLKKSYGEPHWAEKPARVAVREHATLFGLTVSKDKTVDYGTVAPERARTIFIEHALVRGEYASRGKFQNHNRAVMAAAAALRDKARRSEMFVGEAALLSFFDARVGEEVVNGKTFEAFREEAEKSDPNVFRLSLVDVIGAEADLRSEDYPDAITVRGSPLALSYLFDPASDDDGVTLTIPLALVPQLDPRDLQGTVPGMHRQKIHALLQDLPRAHRRDLPAPRDGELVDALARAVDPLGSHYLERISAVLRDETGVDVPTAAFRHDGLPLYLRFQLRVVDPAGKVLGKGRDAREVLERFGAGARALWSEAPRAASWEKKGLVGWSFGDLPPHVTRTVGNVSVRSYLSLVDRGTSVDLVLSESEESALAASRAGMRRLVSLAARAPISAVEPRLPPPLPPLHGALRSRTEEVAWKQALLARIVDEAFGLGGDLVRSKAAFDAMVARGAPRVDATFRAWSGALLPIRDELERLLFALKRAGDLPSGRTAANDIRSQLEHMLPEDWIRSLPFERLKQVPRYLKAAKARLDRAIADPRKDLDKLAGFTPVWNAFLAKLPKARDEEAMRDLRWAFEELRVAIFAPELKTAFPVSAAKLAAAVSAAR